jgi:type I restriction enzyme M protein
VLRGSAVDRTDWKAYILPLLFFKRLSDVWDEETAEAVAIYGDTDPVEYPEIHRFEIPDGCHWRDIREAAANVGAAMARSMREIERANPDTLYRVFGAADWGNRELLSDEILKDLVEELTKVPLGNQAVTTDILGDAYEYLIGRFADVTKRKKAGEFYTPRSVVRMMVDLIDPQERESIYDPACGTGGMLLGAIEHVQRAGGDPRTFFGKIYGQEKNLTTSSIARMNLVLHGIEDFQIVREDTLRRPAFTDSSTGALATFNCVIANPPFSLKEWGREVWEADPWGRAAFGLPPESYGDFAWVQHMVASMAAGTGRMAVVLPQGALFRKDAEGRIRQALLKQDLIEAVIGLAPNIFYGTGLAPAVVVLRRSKPAKRKKKVLVVDASSLFRKGRAQNFLDPEHAQQIVKWVRDFEDTEHRVKVVGLDEIENEDWTLNISRYVVAPLGEEVPPLAQVVATFKAVLTECRAAEDHLREVLTAGGWLA